jgi:F-type H+-transporting ATPase subunit delta
VSVRYATALYELAREKNVAADVDRDVERVGRELGDDQVTAYFGDARVPMSEKRARLDAFAKSVHPLTANFLSLLADKHRLELLPELARAYRRSLLREQGVVEGVVESPRRLPDDELAEIASALGRRLNKQVVLENRVEPGVLAGARVVVDNRMLDASAAGRLEALRSKLLAVRLDSQ